MSENMNMTLGQIAEHFGCEVWMVRNLFKRGLLPEPDRVGQYRYVPRSQLPQVRKALKAAHYLPGQTRRKGRPWPARRKAQRIA